MEELQVVVNQEPGVIKWNFDDLKVALKEEMSRYETMVYDDSCIKDAKADAAMLRKLRKSVEDKRKEIKNKCLEPYDIIEAQAKELTGLIDKPITLIAKQITEYEDQKKAAKKERIMKFMTEAFSMFPQDIQKKAQFATYDSRWENATAKESEWVSAINAKQNEIASSLRIIDGMDADFQQEAMKVYAQNLCLQDAIVRVQDLQKQREMILERERRREEQRRLEAEAAEKARLAAEAQKNVLKAAQEAVPENHVAETHNYEETPAQPVSPMARPIEDMDRQNFARATTPDPIVPAPAATIHLYGADEAHIKKILDYIKFVGVKYEVTR